VERRAADGVRLVPGVLCRHPRVSSAVGRVRPQPTALVTRRGRGTRRMRAAELFKWLQMAERVCSQAGVGGAHSACVATERRQAVRAVETKYHVCECCGDLCEISFR
jgi:hypothetical protein